MPTATRTPLLPYALRAASLALLSAGLLCAGPGYVLSDAAAQGFFDPYGTPSYKVKIKKAKKRPAPADEAGYDAPRGKKSKEDVVAERPSQGPLVVAVSLARQRLVVYDANGPVASSPISSGRVGYSTPPGVYTIVQKKRMHFSNLYGNAPMPNMQRITWSGVALHAGALPGYPASHGCIRLPQGFSNKLFGMTKMGTRVIVSREPVAPAPIAHDRLFAAFPPEGDVAAADRRAPTQVADASQATGGSEIDVTGALVTAAVASDMGSAAPARQSYRERRRLEAERLNAEIRTAGYAKAEKMIEMAAAQKAAAVARQPLIAARAEAERIAGHLDELEHDLAAAGAALAELNAPEDEPTGKKRKRKAKAIEPSKRIAKIAALEAKVARLPAEIEATRSASEHAGAALETAERAAAEAEDNRRAVMAELMTRNATLSQALAKEQATKKLEAMRNLPVSIFVSRAKQRLYVRQGYDDVFDVPVGFDRPDDPIGTHVFTALDFAENKTAMTWSVASVPYDPQRSAKKKKDKQAKKPAEATPIPVDLASQTAAAALDRITIPDDVRDQIADVMKPGSSLVISDLSIGNETGEYTDFIVPLR